MFKIDSRWMLFILLMVVVPGVFSKPIDFNLPDLDGKMHKLSDFRGKWVLVNFWATWCPPCLEEMPELELFHNDHKDRDAIVVGINTENLKPRLLKRFLEDQFVSYPNLVSPGREPAVFGLVDRLPTSYLVSPDGEVVARQVGPITRTALDNFIKTYKKPK